MNELMWHTDPMVLSRLSELWVLMAGSGRVVTSSITTFLPRREKYMYEALLLPVLTLSMQLYGKQGSGCPSGQILRDSSSPVVSTP
jgi:hypothetical protein